MEIFEILAPSGRETKMVEYIENYAKNIGMDCRKDVFGNLICGEGKTVIECGIDSLCFMKTAETENGMIKIAVPNSKGVKTLIGKEVCFLNGIKGVVRSNKTDDIEDFDLSVDVGATTLDEAKKMVETGEFGTISCKIIETEKFIFGNGLSAFVPIIVLLKLMEKIKDKVCFVFTAQKRFNGRGVKALMGDFEVEKVISVNTISENDTIKCGKGVGVVIKEKGAVPTVELRKELISAFDKVQLIATDENLFLDLFQVSGKGAFIGGICIAVRDKDKSFEGVFKEDMENAVSLLENYLN